MVVGTITTTTQTNLDGSHGRVHLQIWPSDWPLVQVNIFTQAYVGGWAIGFFEPSCVSFFNYLLFVAFAFNLVSEPNFRIDR